LNSFYRYIKNNIKGSSAEAFSLSGVFTLVKAIVGLVITKIIAIYFGAESLSVLGNVKNLINISQQMSSFGVYQGTVREISQKNNKVKAIISSASFIIFLASLLFSIISLVYYRELTIILFGNNKYYPFSIIISLSSFFFAFSAIIHSIWNGLSHTRTFYIISIIISIINLLTTVFLMFLFEFEGVVLSLVIVPIIGLLVHFYYLQKLNLITIIRPNLQFIDKRIIKNIINTSIVVLVISSVTPLRQLITRVLITDYQSVFYSGIWEGLNILSNQIYFFFLSVLGVYFYPKISKSLNVYRTTIKVLFQAFIVAIGLLFLIFILDNFVLKLLFSEEFVILSEIIHYQLLGDLFFVLGLVFTNSFLASNQNIKYLIVELLVFVLYITLIYLLIPEFGYQAAVYSHAISAFLYLFFSGLLFSISSNTKS
jgi:O-antigen/teichoic acid export membrane protein